MLFFKGTPEHAELLLTTPQLMLWVVWGVEQGVEVGVCVGVSGGLVQVSNGGRGIHFGWIGVFSLEVLYAPETSMKKCGRGSAKGIHHWGTGTKLKVMFDNDFHPLGDEGSRLEGQLGTTLRNPHRVPLTYLDWNLVPEEIKSAIWKEIEDNIEDCPAEFQPVAMRSCNKLWKDHKAKTKDKYYTKHEEDPDILLKVPKRVLPDQWKELVSCWRTKDAKMSANGENTEKMSVFIKTRDENDPDVKAIVEEFNQNLAEIPESLQTTEFMVNLPGRHMPPLLPISMRSLGKFKACHSDKWYLVCYRVRMTSKMVTKVSLLCQHILHHLMDSSCTAITIMQFSAAVYVVLYCCYELIKDGSAVGVGCYLLLLRRSVD
ncbi:hypothetical protein RHMOL_Rhmol04G0199200 [Rhododendron molle]|uniref:Uncharacterized protein n=1 Tax=Rhododendron molle TaxID=49168 RepID=A0ACC0P3M7_RHOML|nr:hypothetical protein RHMOL_Rhmol04G0199200 [Rhododendron molle]